MNRSFAHLIRANRSFCEKSDEERIYLEELSNLFTPTGMIQGEMYLQFVWGHKKGEKQGEKNESLFLKGECHEIFCHFFIS